MGAVTTWKKSKYEVEEKMKVGIERARKSK